MRTQEESVNLIRWMRDVVERYPQDNITDEDEADTLLCFYELIQKAQRMSPKHRARVVKALEQQDWENIYKTGEIEWK